MSYHDGKEAASGAAPQEIIRPPWRAALIVFLCAAALSYGWRVTGIDPGGLARDFHLIKPLLKALLQPDLITRNTSERVVEAAFILDEDGDAAPAPVAPPPGGDAAALTLSAARGKTGDPLTVEGLRLGAGLAGRLYWVNAAGQEIPLASFTTSREGGVYLQIRVPEMARGDAQKVRAVLAWETGGWHMSRTLELCLEKLAETVFLALMATVFGAAAAVPLSFLGAQNLMGQSAAGRAVYYAARVFFNVLRSVEPLVLAILFAVWVGIGPFAGVLALGAHSAAALGKLYSEQIESLDPGPLEAIAATGAAPLQVAIYGIIPQIVPQFLALTFYRWDINVRMSTIIGFVGGGGIGFLLQQWINLLKYNEAGTALLVITAVVICLDVLSAKAREKLV